MQASWPAFKRSSRFLQLPYQCSFKRINLYPINFPWRPSFFQDSGTLLYPSVTFCPKYTWKTFPGVKKYCHDGERHWWANFNFDAKRSWRWSTRMCPWILKPWRSTPGWIIGTLTRSIFLQYWSLFSFLLNYWHNNEVKYLLLFCDQLFHPALHVLQPARSYKWLLPVQYSCWIKNRWEFKR